MDFWAGVLLIGFPVWLAVFVFIVIKVFKIRGPF